MNKLERLISVYRLFDGRQHRWHDPCYRDDGRNQDVMPAEDHFSTVMLT